MCHAVVYFAVTTYVVAMSLESSFSVCPAAFVLSAAKG